MEKWNSRKFAALVAALLTNLLVYLKVDAETAQGFSTAMLNLLTLGYIIVQGWVDAKGSLNGGNQ